MWCIYIWYARYTHVAVCICAAHCHSLQHTETTLQHPGAGLQRAEHAHANSSALQLTATHCNTLQHTASHCNILQHSAIHCNNLQQPLQHTATTHTLQQHTHTTTCTRRQAQGDSVQAARSTHTLSCLRCHSLPLTASQRNTLQHTATHCNTHCNTLQHTAPHCNNIHTPQHVHARHKVKRHGQHAARTPYPVCAATHCHSRPLTATYCKTLQHTATH